MRDQELAQLELEMAAMAVLVGSGVALAREASAQLAYQLVVLEANPDLLATALALRAAAVQARALERAAQRIAEGLEQGLVLAGLARNPVQAGAVSPADTAAVRE